MELDLERQAEILAQKVRHYMVTHMGRHPQRAYPWEVFQATSLALRENIMVNWASTIQTMNEKRVKRLYYLSMEYLPGRMLSNNISNLHAQALMRRVFENMGYDYDKTLSLEPDPGLGNGGLGRLASCFLESLATQKYPILAYGLRYQYGIFEQQIWEGVQVEKPDCWLLNENPWQLRHDASAKIVKFAGSMRKRTNGHGETVLDLLDYEAVRALPFDFPIVGYSKENDFNVATLRLWSTKESPHNFQLQRYNAGQIGPAAENTALTDVLYPNDNHETGKRTRLKQEFLLVSASLQDIIQRHLDIYPTLENFAEKVCIQINDTHSALVIPELMRILTQKHEFSWKAAFETTQEVVGYTNHTILPEALEEWNRERLASLLPRQYLMIEQINEKLCTNIRKHYPGDDQRVRRMSILENGQIRMAYLAIEGSHKVNGVAKLHGEILKNCVFKDFAELYPEKFTFITNGVSQRQWIELCNPFLAAFLNERIGNEWQTNFSTMERLRDYAKDLKSQKAFLEIKLKNKQRLLGFLKQENTLRDFLGNPLNGHVWASDIDLDSLFDVQIKRIHEYKRQLMNAIYLIMLYFDLLEDPKSHDTKRTSIFSGKAAAGYLNAKYIIQLIYCMARKINQDPAIERKLKIVFVENYCVSKAEILIPAAELSEQISTAGLEASGTGNMKLAMNGALTIGTEDGANIEMREAIKAPWWPFSFGAHASELHTLYHYNPWDIYHRHPKIKRALDALKDGTFAKTESEEEALSHLFDTLMMDSNGQKADAFFVLYDLHSYYETQKRVEALYVDSDKWAEYALHNIAGMSSFSTDGSIDKYAKQIWKLHSCEIDSSVREEVDKLFTDSTLQPHR